MHGARGAGMARGELGFAGSHMNTANPSSDKISTPTGGRM
jgi:hypothetical protein